MSRGTTIRRAEIVGLWGTSVALIVTVEALQQWGVFHGRTATYSVLAATVGTVFPTLGLLILRRHPRHRVGWLFLAMGVAGATELGMSQIAHWIGGGRVAGSLAVGSEALRMINFAALGIILLIYPTGQLLGKRWRWVVVAIGFFGFSTISALITPRTLEDLAPLRGPIRVAALQPLADAIETASGVAMIGVLAAVVSLVVRFRRARSLERQQIKVFAFVAVACVLVISGTSVAVPDLIDTTWLGDAVWNTPIVFLPAAAAFAILRYRLYDIDRIISRTFSYVIITAVVGGIFTLVVLVPTAVVGSGTTPGWLVAVATLTAFALFRPLRRRIQDAVDHRFNRKRYDAIRTVESFSARLRDEVDLETLRTELTGIVEETMQPAHLSLWLRPEQTT